MAKPRQCSECGTVLGADVPRGGCPVCALRRALGAGALQTVEGTEAGAPGAGDPGQWPPSQGRTHRFGDYELLEEVARGGMGVVFRARQVSLNRVVALKMILAGSLATEREVQRFRAEAEAVAKLRHPNIVAIHEVGVHEGQHYFSMDLVQGRNLASLVREHPLPPATAARYVQAIAEAIHHAHQQGVLHRDLKPSNVLIDETDQPRITDFGLAKQFKSDSDLTFSGQVLGSPNFMPPEQAAGRNQDVGPQSDIYSLGAILYHLLTGRPPFAAQTVQATLAKVLQSEPLAPRALNEAVPQDLQTISLKCLEKDPRRRYRTAQELADELGRFLRGEPILARPVGPPEKLWRWCRRNRALAASLSAAVFLLVAIALGSALAAWRIEKARNNETLQRQRAETREAESRERMARLKVAEGWRLIDQGGWFEALAPFTEALALEVGNPKREAAHRARIAYLLQTGPQLRQIWFPGGPLTRVELSPDGERVLTATASLDGHTNEAAAQIWNLRTAQPLTPPMRHAGRINFACFSPDGTRIVTASEDRTARVWNAATGKPVGPPLPHTVGVVHAAFSPDSTRVATCTPAWPVDTNGYIHVWNPVIGKAEVTEQQPGADAQFVLFSPDGQLLLIGCQWFLCNLLDSKTGGSVATVPDCWRTHAASYSPDHLRLLVAGEFGLSGSGFGACLFDTRTWEALTPLLPHSDGPARVVAFDPQGRILATGGSDQVVRLWDASTGQPFAPPLKHTGPIVSATFSPDSRHVLTASRDGTAKVWEVDGGMPAVPPLLHDGPVCGAWFTHDGHQVLTGSEDGAVRLWDLAPATPPQRIVLAKGQVRCARFSPDGRWIVLGDSGGTVEIRDSRSLALALPPFSHSSELKMIKFSAGGHRLLTYGEGTLLQLWDLTETGAKHLWQGGGQIPDISADGRLVAGPGLYTIGHIYYGETGMPATPNLTTLLTNPVSEMTRSAHFSPDGSLLGFAGQYGRVSLWQTSPPQPGPQFLAHAGYVNGLWFSRDGRLLATASDDNTAGIWNVRTGERCGNPLQHSAPVRTAAFSPDGFRVVTASDDATARLWSSPEGQPLVAPLEHHGPVVEACFDARGRRVATASYDGTARVWDAETGEPLTPSLVHGGKVRTVEFSPDGLFLLTASDDQTARLWALPAEDTSPGERASGGRESPRAQTSRDPNGLWARADAPPPRESPTQLIPLRGPKGEASQQLSLDASSLAADLDPLLRSFEQARARGDLDATVRLGQRLSEFATNQWTWLYYRGSARSRLGDHNGAVADFTEAMRIEPRAAICSLARYLARSSSGDPDATADLQAALERVSAFSNLPHAEITNLDPSLPGQWIALATDCTTDLRANPEAPNLLCARAVAHGAISRFRLLGQDLERVYRLEAKQEDPWLALALICRSVAPGRPRYWAHAFDAASRALALKPGDPLAKTVLMEATQHLQQSK